VLLVFTPSRAQSSHFTKISVAIFLTTTATKNEKYYSNTQGVNPSKNSVLK